MLKYKIGVYDMKLIERKYMLRCVQVNVVIFKTHSVWNKNESRAQSYYYILFWSYLQLCNTGRVTCTVNKSLHVYVSRMLGKK